MKVYCCFSIEGMGWNFLSIMKHLLYLANSCKKEIVDYICPTELVVVDQEYCALAFKIGPCAQPEFLAGPARDLLLTLVVPAPSQQWCHSHPEDTSKTFHRREMELKEAGHVVPNDMVCFSLVFLSYSFFTRKGQSSKTRTALCHKHHHHHEPRYLGTKIQRSQSRQIRNTKLASIGTTWRFCKDDSLILALFQKF